MFLYILLALVAVIGVIMLRRSTTPVVKLKPSDMFPFQGIMTDIIKKANESKDEKHHITKKEISFVKEFYDNSIEEFFKLLNAKTEKLAKFEEGEFEKIVKEVSKKLNDELVKKNNIDPKDSKDVKAVKERRNQIILGFMLSLAFGNYVVGGGPAGPNLYATYEKYKDKLTPLLSFYYKGPAFPKGPPAEMGMRPVTPPIATLKVPSEYFPYKRFIDTHLNDVRIFKDGKGNGLNLKQKEIFKSLYNEQMKKLFKRLNHKTKNLRSFKPNQFEEIFKLVFGKMFGDLQRRSMDKKYEEETKLIRLIFPQLIQKLLRDPRIVKGQYGPDFYATYKNQIYDMHSFLSAFYKGPPLPTKGPKTCKNDEKNKNGKCVKIKCPNRGKLTGRNVGPNMVECRFPWGNGGSYTNVTPADSLPELGSSPVSTPTSRSPSPTCKKDEKLKNGRCVKIMCPSGSTMTGNHRYEQTECRDKRRRFQYYYNNSLPERVSTPTSRSPSPTCKKDEKLKNGRCVKIMCPSGSTMTGNHTSGHTECKTLYQRRGRTFSSFQWLNNNSLPERVSTPTSRSPSPPTSRPSSPICAQNEKLKNGKCVRVSCPLGYKHTGQILKRGNEFIHSCKNNKTGMVELIQNEKLPDATCLQYDNKAKCVKYGLSKDSLRVSVSSPGPTRTPTPSPTRKLNPVKPKSTTPSAPICEPAANLGLPKCKDYKLSRGRFPACGERVNVYGKPNFGELNFSIPIGEWRSIDQIRKIPGNPGYTIHGGDGNVSFAFPEKCKLRLTINNGPNFSGPVTFVFTKSCPNSILSGACGQIKFDRRWTYAQSIRVERI